MLPTTVGSRSLFVDVGDYVWTVPFVERVEGGIFLKTAFPDRKATARFLGRQA